MVSVSSFDGQSLAFRDCIGKRFEAIGAIAPTRNCTTCDDNPHATIPRGALRVSGRGPREPIGMRVEIAQNLRSGAIACGAMRGDKRDRIDLEMPRGIGGDVGCGQSRRD